MKSSMTYDEFGFSFDSSGEGVEALGFDIAGLMEEESPLATLEDVWNDKTLRERFPDAIDRVGEHDAAVVLGRLTSLFGAVTIEEGEYPGATFCAPLVVYRVEDGEDEPIAAALLFDQYAMSRLTVVPLEDDIRLARKIAREIWSLVLDDLDDLEDADVRVFHPEDEVWLAFGVVNGEPFFSREDAEEEELEEFEEEPYGQDMYEEEGERER